MLSNSPTLILQVGISEHTHCMLLNDTWHNFNFSPLSKLTLQAAGFCPEASHSVADIA